MYEKEQTKHRCTTHSSIVHSTKGDEYILLKNERMKLLIPYTILESLFTIQGRPIIISSFIALPFRDGTVFVLSHFSFCHSGMGSLFGVFCRLYTCDRYITRDVSFVSLWGRWVANPSGTCCRHLCVFLWRTLYVSYVCVCV